MDKYYNNIKELIENNLIYEKKQETSVNYNRLITYYNIGKEILEAQGGEKRAKYGNKLIKEYSKKLLKEFERKYSERTLRSMRQLYVLFKNEKIWRTVFAKLSWSHLERIILIKDESKRNYYINLVLENNFSVRQLIEHIKSNDFERLMNKENIKLNYSNYSNQESLSILDGIKNPILITMTKSVDKITEKSLRLFMLEEIENTMLELGQGFAFVGSEKSIRINNKILRPDLVFFNIDFNCYVILELKLKELTIKDIGQIEFYVKVYDKDVKKPFHNSTIGITISKRVDKNIIKYNEKENIKHISYKCNQK